MTKNSTHNIKEYKININKTILYYIDDTICLFTGERSDRRSYNNPGKLDAPFHLIKNVGMAIISSMDSNIEEVELKVSELDLLMLREIAKSDIVIDEYPVGIELKEIIHKTLFDEDYQHETRAKKIIEDINRKPSKRHKFCSTCGSYITNISSHVCNILLN